MELTEFRDKMMMSMLLLQTYACESLNPVCREEKITLQQFQILMELSRYPGQTAGNLSDTVGILRGNIAGICKKMEQGNLITRERNPKDERVVLINITEEGKRLQQRILKKVEEKYEKIFVNEPEETFHIIFRGIDELERLMEKMMD